MRWLDGITYSMDMSLSNGEGREACCDGVRGVTKNWTRLSTAEQRQQQREHIPTLPLAGIVNPGLLTHTAS